MSGVVLVVVVVVVVVGFESENYDRELVEPSKRVFLGFKPYFQDLDGFGPVARARPHNICMHCSLPGCGKSGFAPVDRYCVKVVTVEGVIGELGKSQLRIRQRELKRISSKTALVTTTPATTTCMWN